MKTPEEQFYLLDNNAYGPSVEGPLTETERDALIVSRYEEDGEESDQICLDVQFLADGTLHFNAYRPNLDELLDAAEGA